MSDIDIISKMLSLDRKLKFLTNLIKINAKKDDVFTYSLLLEKCGYINLSQQDLRLVLDNLVKLEILKLEGKNRYNHNEYSLNTKKLIKYIYTSELCTEIQEIIHAANFIAVT